jgi:hypothetical protein
MALDLTPLIIGRLKQAMDLTEDLYNSLGEGDLDLNMPELPSNSIGQQAWCIIGARESYTDALQHSGWNGFSCSLKDVHSKTEIIEKLRLTADKISQFFSTSSQSEVQAEFVMKLLEHEVQHHGQLIRYCYANKLIFPKSWNERYTV